jgi:hypothetical protein
MILFILLSCISSQLLNADLPEPVLMKGRYDNAALGYSIAIPEPFVALTNDQSGPQRGFRILLHSNGVISVYGEPNSFEWKEPIEGVRNVLNEENSRNKKHIAIKDGKLGSLSAAWGTLRCGDRLIVTILAFRPGGGPIYWLRLDTLQRYEQEDMKVLNKLAASFEVTEWK